MIYTLKVPFVYCTRLVEILEVACYLLHISSEQCSVMSHWRVQSATVGVATLQINKGYKSEIDLFFC